MTDEQKDGIEEAGLILTCGVASGVLMHLASGKQWIGWAAGLTVVIGLTALSIIKKGK